MAGFKKNSVLDTGTKVFCILCFHKKPLCGRSSWIRNRVWISVHLIVNKRQGYVNPLATTINYGLFILYWIFILFYYTQQCIIHIVLTFVNISLSNSILHNIITTESKLILYPRVVDVKHELTEKQNDHVPYTEKDASMHSR